jgi:hypothetical protein
MTVPKERKEAVLRTRQFLPRPTDAGHRAREHLMKADLQALAKVLLPLSEGESEALAALEWLERETNLPVSINTFFWGRLERAADATLPETEREALRGCCDVGLYRAAFNEHFARRREMRGRGDETP